MAHRKPRSTNRFLESHFQPALVIVLIILVIGLLIFAFIRGKDQIFPGLNQKVQDYTETIEKYAKEYDMTDYVPLVQAVMMQESRGEGTDPMQCSACMFNTEYPTAPGSIEDPEYSINVGIQYLKFCLERAECTGPKDFDRIKLALQGYNYGAGYITWAKDNHGGYTEANARAFSDMMKENHGTSVYGDTNYVNHVLRFYAYKE